MAATEVSLKRPKMAQGRTNNKVVAWWDTENAPCGGGARMNELFGGRDSYVSLLTMGQRIKELCTAVSPSYSAVEDVVVECAAVANLKKAPPNGLNDAVRKNFSMSQWAKLQDAGPKAGAVDIVILRLFNQAMADYYESREAPIALVLISGDGDFIHIVQWAKRVRLPCALIADEQDVNPALKAEVETYKLGAYLSFQSLFPGKDPDPVASPQCAPRLPVAGPQVPVTSADTWYLDYQEGANVLTASMKPNGNAVWCRKSGHGAWNAVAFTYDSPWLASHGDGTWTAPPLCDAHRGRLYFEAAGQYVGYATGTEHLHCQRAQGPEQIVTIERVAGPGPFASHDAARIRFVDGGLYLAVDDGFLVTSPDKPAQFRLVMNTATAAR